MLEEDLYFNFAYMKDIGALVEKEIHPKAL